MSSRRTHPDDLAAPSELAASFLWERLAGKNVGYADVEPGTEGTLR
ncbi:MAG: hypothetical protein ACOH19_02970 [Rhodoglobus sp.]